MSGWGCSPQGFSWLGQRGPALGSYWLIDQLQQFLRVDRLDEVVRETRGRGTGTIMLLTPPGDGDQQNFRAPGFFSNPAGDVLSRDVRQAEVHYDDVRSELFCCALGTRAVISDAYG